MSPTDLARTPGEAYSACQPDQPLEPDDPRYVDLTDVLGGENLADMIAWRVENTAPPTFHQQLVTGHRGCGKSTELRQLQARLVQKGFFAIYRDVEDVLDLAEIKYQDVLVAIARALEEDLREAGIRLDGKLLEEIRAWFDERILTKEQKTDIETSLKAEAGVEGRVPWLARAFASMVALR